MENPEDIFNPFDLANGAAEKLSPPPDFSGPVKRRRITDPLCLLILICIWSLATLLGVWSLQKGNYNILVHPTDYKGRICGIDKDSFGEKLPPLWHVVDNLSNGVCVNECPSESNFEPSSRSDLVCKDDEDLFAMDGCISDGAISDDLDTLITCGGCMYAVGTSKIKHNCVVDSRDTVIEKINEIAEANNLETITEWKCSGMFPYILQFLKDLHTSFYVVVGAFLGSAGIGLLFLVLFILPSCIPVTVWASAVLVPAAFGGGGAFLWFLSSAYAKDESGVHSDSKALIVKILAIAAWSIAGIFLFSLVFLWKKINLSISITKAATRAIREVKLCILFPLIQTAFYAIFLGVMALWLIYLSTTGNFVEETDTMFGNDVTYTQQKFTGFVHYKFWFMILVFVWTSSFFLSFGRLTLTLCYADWYFTPEKDEGNSVSVIGWLFTTLTMHAGTAAFASMTMAPIIVVRAPFLMIQKCIRFSGMDNACVDAFICSCQCFFFVLERFLKFASKNFYVQTAIFGYSFCKSSHESYYLAGRNESNIIDAGPVGILCTFFTRILLTSVTCLASYFSLDFFYGEDLFSVLWVVALIGLMSWFTVGFFTEAVAMSVITLFQCFLADEEMLGEQGSYYVPSEIDEFLARLDESRGGQFAPRKGDDEDDDFTIDSAVRSQQVSYMS